MATHQSAAEPRKEFQPLAGIRVLDFSKVLAGPLCTQHLAELGAEVIKIEGKEGDDTRGWPPFAEDGGTIFLAVNRSKRSFAVDLKQKAALKLMHRLAARCDVVVESFGPGVADRLGIGAEALQGVNPKLVYCSISGYGTQGPMREGKGYDLIAQAFTGMLSITGEPGGPPMRSPFSPVDQATGSHAVCGILAALLQRRHTGRGARLEVSLFDSAIGFLGYFLQSYWQRGTEPVRPGSGHESLCPYQAFETADKPLILGVANDSLWRAFCEVAEAPALADDPRFARGADRVQHRAETIRVVEEILRKRTRSEWLGRLEARGIPCSPVHTLGEVANHPHTAASGMVFQYRGGSGAALNGVPIPLRVDGDRLPLRARPPRLGEHTVEILFESGFDAGEIDALAEAKAIFPPADRA